MRTFRPPAVMRPFNAIVRRIVHLPVPAGPWAMLTVAGRKSGIPRSTPVALVEDGDGWNVMAPYGSVDWVKNVRAAGGAQLTKRGKRIDVAVSELPVDRAAAMLRDSMIRAPKVLRRMFEPYFDTSIDAPLEAWKAEVARHPVFHFVPLAQHAPAIR